MAGSGWTVGSNPSGHASAKNCSAAGFESGQGRQGAVEWQCTVPAGQLRGSTGQSSRGGAVSRAGRRCLRVCRNFSVSAGVAFWPQHPHIWQRAILLVKVQSIADDKLVFLWGGGGAGRRRSRVEVTPRARGQAGADWQALTAGISRRCPPSPRCLLPGCSRPCNQ